MDYESNSGSTRVISPEEYQREISSLNQNEDDAFCFMVKPSTNIPTKKTATVCKPRMGYVKRQSGLLCFVEVQGHSVSRSINVG